MVFSFVSGCPMHMKSSSTVDENQNSIAPAHQERAYEYVECPVKSQMHEKIDPSNMVILGFSPAWFFPNTKMTHLKFFQEIIKEIVLCNLTFISLSSCVDATS